MNDVHKIARDYPPRRAQTECVRRSKSAGDTSLNASAAGSLHAPPSDTFDRLQQISGSKAHGSPGAQGQVPTPDESLGPVRMPTPQITTFFNAAKSFIAPRPVKPAPPPAARLSPTSMHHAKFFPADTSFEVHMLLTDLALHDCPVSLERFSDLLLQARRERRPMGVVILQTEVAGVPFLRAYDAHCVDVFDRTWEIDPVNRAPIQEIHCCFAMPNGAWLVLERCGEVGDLEQPSLGRLLMHEYLRLSPDNRTPFFLFAVTCLLRGQDSDSSVWEEAAAMLLEAARSDAAEPTLLLNQMAADMLCCDSFMRGALGHPREAIAAVISACPELLTDTVLMTCVLHVYAECASAEGLEALLGNHGVDPNLVDKEIDEEEGEEVRATPLYRLLHEDGTAFEAKQKIAVLRKAGGKNFCLVVERGELTENWIPREAATL